MGAGENIHENGKSVDEAFDLRRVGEHSRVLAGAGGITNFQAHHSLAFPWLSARRKLLPHDGGVLLAGDGEWPESLLYCGGRRHGCRCAGRSCQRLH